MASEWQISVNPITGALGAEIEGVSLSVELSEQVFSEVHRAFLDHQVLFFREQRLTPSHLKAFAARFGTLYVHPYVKSLPEHSEVMPVVREADDVGRNFGGSWHADMTFEDEPVLGSVLYAVDVPSYGGDTMFASQYAAYDTLSDSLKQVLVQLNAVHSASATLYGGGHAAAAPKMGLKMVDEIREVTHPVVRIHPETGRRGLFVNRLNTRRFEGRTEAESAPPRVPFHTFGPPRVHVPLPLGARLGRLLGQPVCPAYCSQRLPQPSARDAPGYHLRRSTVRSAEHRRIASRVRLTRPTQARQGGSRWHTVSGIRPSKSSHSAGSAPRSSESTSPSRSMTRRSRSSVRPHGAPTLTSIHAAPDRRSGYRPSA